MVYLAIEIVYLVFGMLDLVYIFGLVYIGFGMLCLVFEMVYLVAGMVYLVFGIVLPLFVPPPALPFFSFQQNGPHCYRTKGSCDNKEQVPVFSFFNNTTLCVYIVSNFYSKQTNKQQTI